jgi:hypothetical protein
MIAFCLVSSDHGPMLVNRFDYNHVMTGDYYGVGAQIMETGCYDPRDVKALRDLAALPAQPLRRRRGCAGLRGQYRGSLG